MEVNNPDLCNGSFVSLLMAPDSSPELFNHLENPFPYNYNHAYDYNINPVVHETLSQIVPNPFYFFHELQPSPVSEISPEFYNPSLPNLLSLENEIQSQPPETIKDDYTLDSILENYLKTSKSNQKRRKNNNETKKNIRHKMSEKIYSLGKLLPGGHRHRKNTAAMLEEAEKYAKFLEAQVEALKCMPTESKLSELSELGGNHELGKLSRQQVLQIVVNSPKAQMVMADNGWCLVSAEQIELMKRIEARQKVIQQLMNNIPL
ncbi:unnamed protein product [Amaranthus hypochondriacus]